ncbi:relaxase domain-containing protein [Streptomyces sp. ALI-76-A]|nr:relaxase domain-containing protein [Streptomyces sp. ALI-76-A]MDL5198922.1 relaxase domain-containing protein [Streptomyces sp. ALI-76-A]
MDAPRPGPLGLTPGEEVTEQQLRNVFGERSRHPYADRIAADRLATGDSPQKAFKAAALGRRVTVTGVDFVFGPQPTTHSLWALRDEETWRVIGAVHERAIEQVLEWIEDEVAVIQYGKEGIYRVWPPGGLVAARSHCPPLTPGRPAQTPAADRPSRAPRHRGRRPNASPTLSTAPARRSTLHTSRAHAPLPRRSRGDQRRARTPTVARRPATSGGSDSPRTVRPMRSDVGRLVRCSP